MTNDLVRAIELANRKIHEEAMRDPASRGMGATIVAARITGSRLALAHVGDSRAYLLRANVLEQLTADHSLVAEQVRHGLMTHQQAAASELQSVLTRALGMEENVEIDADEIELLPRDSASALLGRIDANGVGKRDRRNPGAGAQMLAWPRSGWCSGPMNAAATITSL